MKNKTIACDVLVVGAGVSGFAAAISASRKKVKVIVLEKNSFPGGTAVICMHRYICGLTGNRKGIVSEIADKVSPGRKLLRIGKVRVLPFKTEKLISGLGRIFKGEKRIRIFYNSKAVSVKKVGNRIALVIADYARGKIFIKPKVVIDASGEGDIIKLSGAKYKISALNKRQLSGFSFKVKGLKGDRGILAWKVPYYLAKGVSSKGLPEYFKFSLFSPGDSREEGFIKLSIPPLKHADSGKITNKNSARAHNYLRKSLPEFRNSYITQVSPDVSNREGLRLLGEYVLTKKDILNQKKFPDAVAKGYWPIEFWHKKSGPSFKYLKKGGFYEIPLRSLKSKNISNLFATGRCISADPYALASTRVMGTCISLGEAAGQAASKLCAYS